MSTINLLFALVIAALEWSLSSFITHVHIQQALLHNYIKFQVLIGVQREFCPVHKYTSEPGSMPIHEFWCVGFKLVTMKC